MDSLTHTVVGLSVAALCGETISLSNPAVIACVAGAVIPDMDIVYQLKGHYSYLKNHRGVSHSLPMAVIFSIFITSALWFAFGSISLKNIFLISLYGCFSHLFLDITNSYGAEILWPLLKRKVAFDLLLIYDPILLAIAALAIFQPLKNYVSNFMLIIFFILYLCIRNTMRLYVKKLIINYMEGRYVLKYIRVLPSMIGLLKWQFIVITDEKKVIGDVNIYPKSFSIIKEMNNIDDKLYGLAISTPLADFFKQFTPIFHVECEIKDKNYVFNFIDLRYYIAKDFLHHATAIFNKDFEIVSSIFHPYKKTTNIQV